jgi:hypothetical protein
VRSVPWDEPILAAAIDLLLDLVADADAPDLRDVLVVLPGRRAGRLLLRDLIAAAAAKNLSAFVPPAIATPAVLASLVNAEGAPTAPATSTEVELVAAAAVRDASDEDRSMLAGELDVDAAALSPTVIGAARRLVALEHELAVAGRDPDDAAAALRERGRDDEAAIWDAIARVADDRRGRLLAAGLRDPGLPPVASAPGTGDDLDHARLPERIMLVGLVELPASARRALALAASAGVAIDAVTRGRPASGELADGFDALGCVRPAGWIGLDPGLPDEDLRVGEGLGDQAALAIEAAAEFGRDRPADDVVIGVLEPALGRPLASAAAAAGGSVHLAGGRILGARAAWRLLERLSRWSEARASVDLADLVRIPRFEAILAHHAAAGPHHADDAPPGSDDPDHADDRVTEPPGGRRFTSLIDGFVHDRVPERLEALDHAVVSGHPSDRARLAATRTALAVADGLVSGLAGPPRPLGEWSGPLGDLIAELNADRVGAGVDHEASDEDDWLTLARAADALSSIPPAIDQPVHGPAALTFLVQRTAGEELPGRPEEEAIDVMGLLELPFDPAPAIVIAGVHDGALPRRGHHDPLLPDSLRRDLGLSTDADRLGRDAYLFAAGLRGRTHVRVIAGRRGAGNDPLVPSRLLLPADPAALPARLRRLVSAEAVDRPGALHAAAGPALAAGTPDRPGAPADVEAFGVPLLRGLPAPPSLSVSAFKSYLECPYRFALRHVLKLEAVEDDPRELTPAAFGSVLHGVLDAFSRDAAAKSLTAADAIAEALDTELDRQARRWFGREPRAAVRLQLDRMRQRLAAWATHEAAWRTEGWITVATEYKLKDVPLTFPGPDDAPMLIRATVDRIDRHADTGAWRIIDYKTGDSARHPFPAHHGTKRMPAADAIRWRDLQLPLYRHLLRGQVIEPDLPPLGGTIEVGYVLLPRSVKDVGWSPAAWEETHYESALECARDIVRAVRVGDYEPADRAPRFDDYAWIVQRPAVLLDGAGMDADDEESEGEGEGEGNGTGSGHGYGGGS